tara:strand:- start:808 stop:1014 length:207 start_codon:yes stop_codon:yes gene_type:complete
MDHPLHDDSHLPEPVEMTEDNLEELIEVILDSLTNDDIRCYAEDQFKQIYNSKPNEFQDDWKTYMETR